MTWRAGIIGCGRIGGRFDRPRTHGPVITHAQGYHQHPSYQLVRLGDADPQAVDAMQTSWLVSERYTTLEEFLNHDRLDVISVCTPTQLHCSQLQMIVESPNAPKLILLEKPLCYSLQDLEQMCRLQQSSGIPIVVNYSRRFDDTHQEVVRLIRDGVMGELIGAAGTYYGGWVNNGSHLIDLFMQSFPGESIVVKSVSLGAPGRPGDPCWDVELAIGDVSCALESVDESNYQLLEIEMRFSHGRVVFRDFGNRIDVERCAVNDIAERVLVPRDGSPYCAMQRPLFNALTYVDRVLCGKMEHEAVESQWDLAVRVAQLCGDVQKGSV